MTARQHRGARTDRERDFPQCNGRARHDGAAMSANIKEAVNFLEALRPGGPWLLTAIVPDGKTTTQTLRNAKKVETFLDKHDGKRNLYYSVNPTRTALSKKAAKTDIAAIEYALADLDPNAGETSEA